MKWFNCKLHLHWNDAHARAIINEGTRVKQVVCTRNIFHVRGLPDRRSGIGNWTLHGQSYEQSDVTWRHGEMRWVRSNRKNWTYRCYAMYTCALTVAPRTCIPTPAVSPPLATLAVTWSVPGKRGTCPDLCTQRAPHFLLLSQFIKNILMQSYQPRQL